MEGFPFVLRWKRLAGAEGAAVAWNDSVLFVGDDAGRLMAVGREDGVRRWVRRGSGPLKMPLAFAGGSVFFSDTWGRIGARAAGDGAAHWQFQRLGWGDAAIAVDGKRVYAAGRDGWLYGLARENGAARWRVRLGGGRTVGLSLGKGRAYAVTAGGVLWSVDAATGRRLFNAETGTRLRGGVVWGAGRIVVGGGDGYLRAYKAERLELLWEVRLGALCVGRPLLKGGMVVAAADNGWVYAFNAKDGTLRWKHDLGAEPSGRPVAVGGAVVVPTAVGDLVALEEADGRVRWRQILLEGVPLAVWAAGDDLYVRAGDGYLYAFGPAPAAAAVSGALWDEWWESVDFGRKTGYVRQTATKDRFEGRPALLLDHESVAWRSGFSRTSSRLWTDDDWRPLAFERRVVEESQVIETHVRWRAGGLEVVRRLDAGGGGSEVRWLLPAVGPVEAPQTLFHRLGIAGRAGLYPVGGRDTVQVVDLSALQIEQLALVFSAAGSRLEARSWPVGEAAADIEKVDLFDPAGRHLLSAQPGLGAAYRRTTAHQARAWTPPGEGKTVYLDREVPVPAALDEAVVRLPDSLGDWREFLVEDQRQRVETGPEGSQIHLVRSAYAGQGAARLPFTAPELAPFLEPSLYIQSDDERIAELARKIKGDERDAWKVAQRLQRWVYDHMIPANTDVRFKSSVEVLQDMQGTCSEYTALYLALCRAAGVPARAAVGLVFGRQHAMTLHIWAQVFVGRWVDVDPSWDQMQVDAAHITAAVGVLRPASMARMNLALQRLLARADTLQLAEWRSADERMLAEAEDLFAAAAQAQSRYEDEMAMELYHRLVLLPWNRRSAETLVEIGRYRQRQGRLDDAAWAFERLGRAPGGQAAGQGLFYLARLASARGDTAASMARLEEMVTGHPGNPLADEALGELARLREAREGCRRARPYYLRLREEYGRSGWAAVADNALRRCREKEALLAPGAVDEDGRIP